MLEASAAKLFHDLGHPVRVRILEGEKNVGELMEALGGMSQGRVFSHLT